MVVRLGYVGCGIMAQKVHLPNFCALVDCEVVGLAEVRDFEALPAPSGDDGRQGD